MPRAGWAGGMLRAPKLYQSVSISGPSVDLEAHAHEHVLQQASGLGDEAGVAPGDRERGRARDELGEVDPAPGHLRGQLGLGHRSPAFLDEPIDGGPGIVQSTAELFALVRTEGAERPSGRGQRRLLACHRAGHLPHVLGRRGVGQGPPGLLDQGVEVGGGIGLNHGRPPGLSAPPGPLVPSACPRFERRAVGSVVGPPVGPPVGVTAPPPVRRWRRASKHSTEADTATFSDSARPTMGTDTRASRRLISASSSPEASFPKTRATRCRQSNPA